MASVRSIIALASHHGWTIFLLDVANAFLHGNLHEVYIRMLEGVPNLDNKENPCMG